MLVDRCPGCGKPVAEADTSCPHCDRDFTASAARKPPPRPAPERDREPAPETRAEAPPVPQTPAPDEEAPRAKPAPKAKPRLEEPEPVRDSVPAPSAPFEVDTPQAYVPGGYAPQEDSYKVTKEPARPPWHWMAMAVVCVVAFKFINIKGPQPLPKDGAAPAQETPPPDAQPAAPVAVPTDIPGALRALSDAKDAAAAAGAAAEPTMGAAIKAAQGLGDAPPLRRPAKPRRKAPQPVEPEDVESPPEDSAIVITPSGVSDEPRRRDAPAASQEWRMRGAIYDLLSTDPVKNADVVFMDAKTGRRFATGTDAQGRYRATLPVTGGGYDLAIRHPKYEPKYFEDGVPSYRQQGPEQRTSAAADLMRILQTKEMIVGVGGTVIERDFILIPLERP